MNRFRCLVGLALGATLPWVACSRSASSPPPPVVAVDIGGRSTHAEVQHVSAPVFRPLGVAPMIGRDFIVSDFQPGSPGVAIVSAELWTDALGSRPDAIGQEIRVGDSKLMVVGVAPGSRSDLAGRKIWVSKQE